MTASLKLYNEEGVELFNSSTMKIFVLTDSYQMSLPCTVQGKNTFRIECPSAIAGRSLICVTLNSTNPDHVFSISTTATYIADTTGYFNVVIVYNKSLVTNPTNIPVNIKVFRF